MFTVCARVQEQEIYDRQIPLATVFFNFLDSALHIHTDAMSLHLAETNHTLKAVILCFDPLGHAFNVPSMPGCRTLCAMCMTIDGPYSPDQKENLEESIRKILAQLLNINENSVAIRVILTGSVMVIFTIPLKSAEYLQTLWRTKAGVIKDAFLHPPGDHHSLTLRAMTRTAGGREWPLTAKSLSGQQEGEKNL